MSQASLNIGLKYNLKVHKRLTMYDREIKLTLCTQCETHGHTCVCVCTQMLHIYLNMRDIYTIRKYDNSNVRKINNVH